MAWSNRANKCANSPSQGIGENPSSLDRNLDLGLFCAGT
jgi:hypothetical protein